MKFKIIDLLVKIANGEKIPKKIKYMDSIWEYCKNGTTQDYINDYGNCLMEFVPIIKVGLNDEVEIIEESKKIEKISWNEKESLAGNLTAVGKQGVLTRRTEKLKASLNELIDEINKLKENEHEI